MTVTAGPNGGESAFSLGKKATLHGFQFSRTVYSFTAILEPFH